MCMHSFAFLRDSNNFIGSTYEVPDFNVSYRLAGLLAIAYKYV